MRCIVTQNLQTGCWTWILTRGNGRALVQSNDEGYTRRDRAVQAVQELVKLLRQNEPTFQIGPGVNRHHRTQRALTLGELLEQ